MTKRIPTVKTAPLPTAKKEFPILKRDQKRPSIEKCNTPNPTASTFNAITEYSRTFGNRLRLRRLLLGWSQKEMAAALDVSPRAVWKWETGKPPILLTQEAVDARLKIVENQRKKNLKK